MRADHRTSVGLAARARAGARAVLLAGLWLALAAQLCQSAEGRGPRGLNLALVFIDTLRADHVHALGYPRETTPYLDRLAAEGTLYENAMAQSSWSLPSYATVMTGVYPPTHTLLSSSRRLDERFVTLASILAAHGYRTGAFTGGVHCSSAFGLARGFGTFQERPHDAGFADTVPKALGWLGADRTDPLLTRPRRAKAGVGGPGTSPWFLWLHGYDVHEPYDPPLGLGEIFDPGYAGPLHRPGALRFLPRRQVAGAPRQPDEESVPVSADTTLSARDVRHAIAHYDGGVLAADAWLGVFVESLRASGRLDDTLLVVASDHGEEFGEHGRFGHPEDAVWNSLIHVPLLIVGPGVARGRRVSATVELAALAPTLLELAGIPTCHQHEARSVAASCLASRPAEADAERPAFSQAARVASVREGRWHLIRWITGTSRLFDVHADPAEQTDLSGKFPVEVARLASLLDDWLERFASPPAGPPSALSERDRALFRRIGYW